MSALIRDRNTEYSMGDMLAIPVAGSTRIFAGSLVCTNADGYGVPAADTTGLTFEGVAVEQADNRLGSDGDMNIVVRRRGRYRFRSRTALVQGALCARAYAVDDQTIEPDAAQVTNDVQVGVVDRIESAHDCWIAIDAAVLAGKAWTEPTTTTAAPTTTSTTA